jgi:hypothetical protein
MPVMDDQTKDNLRRAGLLAASDQPHDHEQLLNLLNSREYLGSLQPLEQYNSELPKRLIVARLIKTLMTSPHDIARTTIARLVRSAPFLTLESLEELLIIALVAVRPLPPEAVAYLHERSTPESTPLHLVMVTLAANSSEPALRLFEAKIADVDHDEGDRAIWLQAEYLIRRNDVAILNSYRRMIIERTVPPEMQLVALESLCSYDPQWYLACTKPEPPLRLAASSEAKEILREIIDYAQEQMELTAELEQAVATVSLEIGEGERS